MEIFRSRLFVFSAVFLFVIQFFSHVAASGATLDRLIADLTAKQQPFTIPSMDGPVNVKIAFSVHNIDLDEQERKITIQAYFSKQWKDARLRWNASDYDNIDSIRLPSRLIWTPDIVLYNFHELRNHNELHDNAVLFRTGSVMYIPRIIDSAPCSLDMSKFPFDTQFCQFIYGSWVYSNEQVNLSSSSSILGDNFIQNEKWEVLSAKSKIDVSYYPCCPEGYMSYRMTFGLRRHFVYSCQVLIFPAVIIAALIPFMFLLPSESRERITLGIALIVISVMQINVINNILPKGYVTTPVILSYHILTLFLIALSVILSIFILNIYNRGPRRKKLPQILRTIFLKGLRKLVCLGNDTYQPTDDQEAMSMRGVSQPNEKDVVVGVQDEKPPQTSAGNVDEANRHMQSLAQRGNILDARQEILAEWQQMAMVIDRILFILFLVIFVISTISLFTDASYEGIKHAL